MNKTKTFYKVRTNLGYCKFQSLIELSNYIKNQRTTHNVEIVVKKITKVTEEPLTDSIIEEINSGDFNKKLNDDIIKEGTKVKIISTSTISKDTKYIYQNQIGKVLHYWKGNPYGEYNVILPNGCNNTFNRKDLQPIYESNALQSLI